MGRIGSPECRREISQSRDAPLSRIGRFGSPERKRERGPLIRKRTPLEDGAHRIARMQARARSANWGTHPSGGSGASDRQNASESAFRKFHAHGPCHFMTRSVWPWPHGSAIRQVSVHGQKNFTNRPVWPWPHGKARSLRNRPTLRFPFLRSVWPGPHGKGQS